MGSSDGLSTIPDWTYEGGLTDAIFGNALGDAGDVNGDGYDDIVVGAPHLDVIDNEEGAAYVFHGNHQV